MWPFLYFADDRLSTAELASARLDGDVVEVGVSPGEVGSVGDVVGVAVNSGISPNATVVVRLADTRTIKVLSVVDV